MPKKLNFAVFGTISFIGVGIDVSCDDFHIGQSDHLFENLPDWWLCSPNCKTVAGNDQGTCTCDGGSVYITKGKNGHEFYVHPTSNATEPINFLQ